MDSSSERDTQPLAAAPCDTGQPVAAAPPPRTPAEDRLAPVRQELDAILANLAAKDAASADAAPGPDLRLSRLLRRRMRLSLSLLRSALAEDDDR